MHWALIEADFYREYGVRDFGRWLRSVSVRVFFTLLAGLSSESRLVSQMRADGGPVRFASEEEGLAIFSAIGR